MSLTAPLVHAHPHPPEAKIPHHAWHGHEGDDYGWVQAGLPVDGASCASVQGATIPKKEGSRLDLGDLHEGESVTYCVRLTKEPLAVNDDGSRVDGGGTAEDWWILLRVNQDGKGLPSDGSESLRWVPSVGRGGISGNGDPMKATPWQTVTIYAREDEDRADHQVVTFTHEVWDSYANCPFLGTEVRLRIIDDQGPNVPPRTLTILDAEVDEGDATAPFRVTLSRSSTGTVRVNYETRDGTAMEPDDYTSSSGELEFAPGDLTKTIDVPIVDDSTPELTEAFTVALSTPSGASLAAKNTATGTIIDNDPGTVTVNSEGRVNEGERARFTVTLNGGSQSVKVKYQTRDGDAKAPLDYTAVHFPGPLELTPGASRTIDVQTENDSIAEQTEEDFTLTLRDFDDNTLLGEATVIIVDDDESDVTIDDVTVNERDGTARFTVTLLNSESMTVSYTTANETALAGSDYQTATDDDLTFNPGEMQIDRRWRRRIDDSLAESDRGVHPSPSQTDADNSYSGRLRRAPSSTTTMSGGGGGGRVGDRAVEPGQWWWWWWWWRRRRWMVVNWWWWWMVERRAAVVVDWWWW